LNDARIGTNKHYPIPMHLQECYKDLGFHKGDFPIAEEISATELSVKSVCFKYAVDGKHMR